MNKIEFFSPPDGDIITNPDLRFLKILFLYVGAEYWSSGSGDSYLDFDSESLSSRLEIIFHPASGFFIRYQAPGTDLHSINSAHDNSTAQVYIGGNLISIPTHFFISREEAFSVVSHFCTTGLMSEIIEWQE